MHHSSLSFGCVCAMVQINALSAMNETLMTERSDVSAQLAQTVHELKQSRAALADYIEACEAGSNAANASAVQPEEGTGAPKRATRSSLRAVSTTEATVAKTTARRVKTVRVYGSVPSAILKSHRSSTKFGCVHIAVNFVRACKCKLCVALCASGWVGVQDPEVVRMQLQLAEMAEQLVLSEQRVATLEDEERRTDLAQVAGEYCACLRGRQLQAGCVAREIQLKAAACCKEACL